MSARDVQTAVRLDTLTPCPGSRTQPPYVDSSTTTADNSARGLQSTASNTDSAIAPPAAASDGTSPPLASPSSQSQILPARSARISWWKRLTRKCSSTYLTVIMAMVTLGAGAYYFYGQYTIARQTLDVELWKDYHDRKVCNQLHNAPSTVLAESFSQD